MRAVRLANPKSITISVFPGRPYHEITREVRALSASSGVQIVGSLYHVSDGGWRREHEDGAPGRWDLDFNDPDFWEALDERVQADKELGSEYVTFQISLPPEHLNTGGEYRDDRAYVQRAAERIARMQEVVFRHGLNFYVETHIDRLSEDVVGFARIMDACPVYFEVNADISHYVYRGIKKGSALAKILGRVGHTHQRMAREHGDLSADVAGAPKPWITHLPRFLGFFPFSPGLMAAFSGSLASRRRKWRKRVKNGQKTGENGIKTLQKTVLTHASAGWQTQRRTGRRRG